MSSHPVLLHIQIIDHLDHDTSQSYELLAHQQYDPRFFTYLENDGLTKVEFMIEEETLTLKRNSAWKTQIHFNLKGLGSFTVISDEGSLSGQVKTLKVLIESNTISVTYQLLMDGAIITHQTLTYIIKGAQA
jgi:hypothetical protein